MPHSLIPQSDTSRPVLRIVGEDDPPTYDADPVTVPRTGFAMIPAAVFDMCSGDVIAVYGVLANHANRQGECWPSMKRLESCLGWSDNRIRPALKRLIDSGLVTVEKRQLNGMSQSNLYTLTNMLPPNEQVSRDRIAVSRSGALGIPSRGVGYPVAGHEPEPVEQEENVKTATPKKSKPSSPDTPVPENLIDLIPPETWQAMRDETRLTDSQLQFETALMIDRNLRKGGTSKNWIASWRSWMRSQYRQSQPLTASNGHGEMPPEIARLPWNSAAKLKWENDHRKATT